MRSVPSSKSAAITATSAAVMFSSSNRRALRRGISCWMGPQNTTASTSRNSMRLSAKIRGFHSPLPGISIAFNSIFPLCRVSTRNSSQPTATAPRVYR